MTKLSSSFSRAGAARLLAAAFLVGAPVSDAFAQNLIQNGGFDVSPPTACGNNYPWPIPPWVVLGSSQSNVVVVDDNVSCHYGNLGPQKDASAPGSGVKQYYLDIANGTNKFYQSFKVPSCQSAPDGSKATVTFGGYFSSRENLSGTGTIWLENGVGDTGNLIVTLPVNIPPGPSQTTPWTHVTGSASVVRGATISYVVYMDNNVNFDNAHLTIDADACNPPPPPPPGQGCLSTDSKVTCNGDGTVTVTLTAAGFSGDTITLASLTPGVTVSTPQQPWAATTTWVLSGTTAG